VKTYSEILLRDAICTHTTHSILYSDFLNICIYIHIYNRTLTSIKTNKKMLLLSGNSAAAKFLALKYHDYNNKLEVRKSAADP